MNIVKHTTDIDTFHATRITRANVGSGPVTGVELSKRDHAQDGFQKAVESIDFNPL